MHTDGTTDVFDAEEVYAAYTLRKYGEEMVPPTLYECAPYAGGMRDAFWANVALSTKPASTERHAAHMRFRHCVLAVVECLVDAMGAWWSMQAKMPTTAQRLRIEVSRRYAEALRANCLYLRGGVGPGMTLDMVTSIICAPSGRYVPLEPRGDGSYTMTLEAPPRPLYLSPVRLVDAG